MRTVAKVGGLVGEVIEVDEGTRFRYDYVRLRIACRDVTKVPKTAEGAMGMFLIDFGFEREVTEGGNEKVLKSGINLGTDAPSSANKPKPVMEPANPTTENGNENSSIPLRTDNDKAAGKQKMIWSAPPKINVKAQDQSTFMKDAQKAYKRSWDEDEEKVQMWF